MKTTREWKQVTITKKGTKKLQSGHPWVYEGEVLALEANIQNGDITEIHESVSACYPVMPMTDSMRIFFTAVCSMQSATVQQLWERILMPVA